MLRRKFFSMFFVRQDPDWWATFLPCVEPIPSLDERPEEGGERRWFGRWGSGEVVGRYGVDQAALWLDSYGDQTSQGGQEHVSVGVWELVPLRLLVLWQWVGASNSVDECRYDSLFHTKECKDLNFEPFSRPLNQLMEEKVTAEVSKLADINRRYYEMMAEK